MLVETTKPLPFREGHDKELYEKKSYEGFPWELQVYTCDCSPDIWTVLIASTTLGDGYLIWEKLLSQSNEENFRLLLAELVCSIPHLKEDEKNMLAVKQTKLSNANSGSIH